MPKKNDIKQIINIAKENNLNSRFLIDKLISKKFKERYRSEWVKNFFRKKEVTIYWWWNKIKKY